MELMAKELSDDYDYECEYFFECGVLWLVLLFSMRVLLLRRVD